MGPFMWMSAMIGGLFMIYGKGHQLVNRPTPPDPVLDAIHELGERFTNIEARVSALEAKYGGEDI